MVDILRTAITGILSPTFSRYTNQLVEDNLAVKCLIGVTPIGFAEL